MHEIMIKYKTVTIACFAGIISVVIGAITFSISWLFWDLSKGPMPGYEMLLLPGNLTLVHIWHPLFTEEVNLIPKLILILAGQFVVVFCVAGVFTWSVRQLFSKA